MTGVSMDPDNANVWNRIVAPFRRRYKREPWPSEAIRLKNSLRLAAEHHRAPLKWVVEALSNISDPDPLSSIERRLERARARSSGSLNRPVVALSRGGYCPDAYLVVLGGFENNDEGTRLVPVKRYGRTLLLQTGRHIKVRDDQHFVPCADTGPGARILAKDLSRATSDDFLRWSDLADHGAVTALPD